MNEKSFNCEVRLLNSSTGEVLSVKKKVLTMFCEGSGEKFIDDWVACLKRGLRQFDDGLCIEMNFKPVKVLDVPLVFA